MNQHQQPSGSMNSTQFNPQATSQPFPGYPTLPPTSGHWNIPYHPVPYVHPFPGHHFNPYANYVNPYMNHVNPYANHGHYHSNWAGNFYPHYPTAMYEGGYTSHCNPCVPYIPQIQMPKPICPPPKEHDCSCGTKEDKCAPHNYFNFDQYYQLLISNQSLISQIKYLEFELAKHIEMIKALKEEKKELERKLEIKDDKIKELEEKLKKSENEADKLKDKIKELEDKNKKLEEELAKERAKKKDCSAVEKLLEKERKTSAELAGKLDDLKTEVINAQSPSDIEQIKNKIAEKTFDSPIKL